MATSRQRRATAGFQAQEPITTPLRVSDMAVQRSRQRRSSERAAVDPFRPAHFPPGVVGAKSGAIAMDEAASDNIAWAAQAYQGLALAEGQGFLGYPYLSLLAQRGEYRRIVETIATEMTRKWVRFVSIGGGDKAKRIAELEAEFRRLDVRGAFRKAIELDGFFGRGHLHLGVKGDESNEEICTPIGNGRGDVSEAKIGRHGLLRLRAVEPYWAAPDPGGLNTTDPLRPGFYRPSAWNVMGRRVHGSRLLTFVAREVPDVLKAAYGFGGLSMTQMAKPYVDNWLKTRESVSDLVASFSVCGVKGMDLVAALASGGAELDNLFNRIEVFNNLRDNRGFMALNGNEEFFNVSTSLSTLDKLQAQSQEHIASICGVPLVKLLGITPSGLNASSDGEIRVFYDTIHAAQERQIRPNLDVVLRFVQLSLWGQVDDDIGYEFEPLWQMSDKEKAEVAGLRTAAVMSAEPALPTATVLRELREMADATGVFTQITDDDIDETSTQAPAPDTDPNAGQPDGAESLPGMDEWQESKHPRAGNGQFGSGGGSGSSSNSARNSQSETVRQRVKLTEQQHVDVKDYKEGGFQGLNAYLRGTQTRSDVAAEYEKTAKRIDAAIAKSSLKQDIKLYRGIDHPALAANAEKLIGRDVDVASFQSTSTDVRVATDFAGMGKGAIVFQINAKAGTPALGMDQFEVSGNSGENEVLLGRSGKMRITGVDRSGSVPVIHAEYIASNPDKPRTSRDSLHAEDEAIKRHPSRFVISEEEADEIFGKYLQG